MFVSYFESYWLWERSKLCVSPDKGLKVGPFPRLFRFRQIGSCEVANYSKSKFSVLSKSSPLCKCKKSWVPLALF